MNADKLLARHLKAEEKAMSALYKSADAMLELYRSADAAMLPGVGGADDQRLTLSNSMMEFAAFLEIRINYRKAQKS